jgi:hypothetical protein
MKKAFIALTISYLSLVAIAAGAHMDKVHENFGSCDVEFDSNITVSPDAIEIESTAGSRMEIGAQYDLWIDDVKVDLDTSERALVQSYADQVRATIPEIVALALDGVEIGLTAVSEVFYAFSEDGPPEALLDSINNIQEEVAARMYRNGNTVHMKGGEIRGLEETMSELEPALEDAISESVADIILAVGRSIRDGEGSLAERIAILTDRAQQLEQTMESKIADRASELEQRADGLCEQVYALQASERRLHLEIPATRVFDLVKGS